MRRSKSTGLTFIELLVILGGVTVILCLVSPALLESREASRRTSCAANLKKLGLAMHNYHDAYRVFPPGITSWNNPAAGRYCEYVATSSPCIPASLPSPASNSSAFTLLLPFVDQHRTHAEYNMDLPGCGPQNSTSVRTIVDAFVCPSNDRGTSLVVDKYYFADAGPVDYLLPIGASSLLTCPGSYTRMITYRHFGYPFTLKPGAGVFNVNSCTNLREIRDGTSTTFLLGEGAGGPQLRAGNPDGAIVPFQFVDAEPPDPISGSTVDQAWSQGYIGGPGGIGGYGSVFAATAHDAWYDSQLRLGPPDGSAGGFTPLRMNMNKLAWIRGTSYANSLSRGFPAYWFPPTKFELPNSVSGFRSFHPGVCQFLMADGTVKVLNETIDPVVYVGLSTISGREVLPSDY